MSRRLPPGAKVLALTDLPECVRVALESGATALSIGYDEEGQIITAEEVDEAQDVLDHFRIDPPPVFKLDAAELPEHAPGQHSDVTGFYNRRKQRWPRTKGKKRK